MRGTRINQKVAVAVVFVAAMFMTIMDATIVNVALPTLGHTFGVPATSVDTVAIYFLVSLAVVIPASGWLGDRFGGKRVLLASIVVFTVSSVLCGLAGSLTELVVFRVVQGIGGGMLVPVGMAMLFRAYPPAERVQASAVLTVPTTLAPALGPVLGGLLVTDLSWRWVFFVNVPLGIAAFAFGLAFLDHDTPHRPGRFDTAGFVLSGGGLGLLMYGISEGPILGWNRAVVLASIAGGGLLAVGAVATELRVPEPLLDLRLLANRLFRTSNVVMVLGAAAFLGAIYLSSLFYQDGRGLTALASGLSIFPEAIGVMSGAQLASRYLYPTLGPRRHVTMGLVGVAASVGCMALIGSDTSLWWMRLLMYTMGFAMAQVFVPIQAAAFATITPAETGRASTMFNAVRQLGSAVGVALVTTAIVAVGTTTHVVGHVAPHLTAYHAGFLLAAALAALGAAAALRIVDADAASTIVPRRHRAERATGRPAATIPAPGEAPAAAVG
ncbi:MAG: MDR family MFS transporter [Acidimicrobiales bacterium]